MRVAHWLILTISETIWNSGLLITSVLARILAMLIIFKYLSVHFGPAGFGKLSQVMAIGALFSTFAGGGLFNGLVREVAASNNMDEKLSWLLAALATSIASSIILLIIACLMYFFGAQLVFADTTLAWVFILMGIAQFATAFGNTAFAYLSGLGAIKFYSLAGIFGSLFSIAIVVVTTQYFGFQGAVAGTAVFALAPSIFAIAVLYFKMPDQMTRLRQVTLDVAKVKRLLLFSMSMMVAAVAVPLVLLHMRSILGRTAGWDAVGEWQSVARIGEAYIQFFGVIFINLMLPRLSVIDDHANQRKTVLQFSMMTTALFLVVAVVFLVFPDFIIGTIYSRAFSNAKDYVLPQLLGDFLKIAASWFVYLYIARGKPAVQAVGEVIQAFVMFGVFHVAFSFAETHAAVWSYVAGVASVLVFLFLLQTKIINCFK